MSQRFPITINDDGTVTWHGVDTGKTRVLARNKGQKIIVLHTAGSSYTSGQIQCYAPAKVTVHEYENNAKFEDGSQIYLKELFGILEYSPRSNNWTPNVGARR